MQTEMNQYSVTVHGAAYTVTEMGHGAPVLLLHGSPDSGDMWLPLMERLGSDVRSMAPDLPGFGRSPLPKDFALSLDHMADFIAGLLDSLGVREPVVVVSTDFGGHYGLAFAVKYPDRVRGLAISNTNFSREYRWHTFAQLYRMPLLGDLLLAGSSKALIVKTMKGFAPALPDDYLDQSYPLGFGSASVRKAILRMYRARDSKDFAGWDDRLLALLQHTPAIVLWGDRDPFIDPSFADWFGGAEVHHFAAYSHWLPLEAPDAYAAALIAWLARLAPAAATSPAITASAA